MKSLFKGLRKLGLIGAAVVLAPSAFADSISPVFYEDTVGIGGSVTIEKTVVIEASGPTDALIDVMFLFDNTGSMGGEISAAKSKASDILNSLEAFGDVASGTGWYNDPGVNGVLTDLVADDVVGAANIQGVPFFSGSGGDADEQGVAGIIQATSASWRDSSNRYVIGFGDAAFKGSNAAAIAALNGVNATFIGVGFSGGGSNFFSDATPIANATGGSTHSASATGNSIASAITAGITASFANYTEVTVSDLGGGLPGVDVSVVCTSADTGACSGADAIGTYDRSVDRTFTFDVTFTGVEAGDHTFPTWALVDDGIVATELDVIHVVAGVPEPSTMLLLLSSLLAMFGFRPRRLTA